MNRYNTNLQGSVLVVDDDPDILQAAKFALQRSVERIDSLGDPHGIVERLERQSPDVILLDMNFTRDVTSGCEGFDWLERVLQHDPDAVVILVTAFGDTEIAVRAIKAGATDFIVKPWENDKLVATVLAGIKLRRSRFQISSLKSRERQLNADLDKPFSDFIGDSPGMRQVFGLIRKVADTDANVLVLGENGTGKELVAREVHRLSERSNNVFCRVDLGALSESLFESELFGHVKGAFTDAREARPGRFEVANGGTLFLDEIASLPSPLQPKLLTAIENREVTRVGSNDPTSVDIRLICASNVPLQESVHSGDFREDLFYRINTVVIHIPPLRERLEDVALLADHFLERYGRKYYKQKLSLGDDALKGLMSYNWPGNVRELQHMIERAVILSDHDVLEAEDFESLSSGRAAARFERDTYDLEEIEKEAIQRALARFGGNITKAAGALGLTRPALYRRMKKHDL